jgi:hypothetical protein
LPYEEKNQQGRAFNGLNNDKVVILTFGDGFESQYLYAKPILDKYSFKANFFVTCNKVETNSKMNWQEVVQLYNEGHVIGSKTRIIFCPHRRYNDSKCCTIRQRCHNEEITTSNFTSGYTKNKLFINSFISSSLCHFPNTLYIRDTYPNQEPFDYMKPAYQWLYEIKVKKYLLKMIYNHSIMICAIQEKNRVYILSYFALFPSSYLLALGNIIPSLCIITKTIPTADATSNNENTLLCPSSCKKFLNPNGLAAKNNNTTSVDESIANSLNFLLLSDILSAGIIDLCVILRQQSTPCIR